MLCICVSGCSVVLYACCVSVVLCVVLCFSIKTELRIIITHVRGQGINVHRLGVVVLC